MANNNNNGTIFFEKSRNKWTFRCIENGKRVYKRFDTRAAAVAAQEDRNHLMRMGTYVQDCKLTLRAWMLQWLEVKKPQLKPTTMARYINTSALTIPIGSMKLQDIRPLHIERLYLMWQKSSDEDSDAKRLDKILKQYYSNVPPQNRPSLQSASSIGKLHKMLFAAFTYAYNNDLIAKNIMDRVKPPRIEKSEIRVFGEDEIKALFDSIKAKNERYFPLFYTLYSTGMRLGEVLALQWSDVDFKKQVIHIKHNLMNSIYENEIADTKTRAGNRVIPLPLPLIPILKKLRSERKIAAVNGFVFATKDGTNHLLHSNVERFWKTLSEKNIHCLRHTYASTLLAAGVPVTEVARLLGHATPATTMSIYGHCLPNTNDILQEKLSMCFSL